MDATRSVSHTGYQASVTPRCRVPAHHVATDIACPYAALTGKVQLWGPRSHRCVSPKILHRTETEPGISQKWIFQKITEKREKFKKI